MQTIVEKPLYASFTFTVRRIKQRYLCGVFVPGENDAGDCGGQDEDLLSESGLRFLHGSVQIILSTKYRQQ